MKEGAATIWKVGAGIVIFTGAFFGIRYLYLKGNRKKHVSCNSKFLFVGDSTTAGNVSYADQLSKLCPRAKVKKIAQVGAGTDWMLNELKKELVSGNKYDVISILGGSNDIFGRLSVDQTKLNLQQMYDLSHNNGAMVVGITPPSKQFYPKTTDQHRKLISELTNWMSANKSIDKYIDWAPMLNNRNLFASDMEHPNAAGHKLLLDEFVKDLKLKSN